MVGDIDFLRSYILTISSNFAIFATEILKSPYDPKFLEIKLHMLVLFCFVYSGPRPSPVMGCPYSGILTSSPRGWRVCNTPSSQEGTLSTPKGYGEGPGRIPSQVNKKEEQIPI